MKVGSCKGHHTPLLAPPARRSTVIHASPAQSERLFFGACLSSTQERTSLISADNDVETLVFLRSFLAAIDRCLEEVQTTPRAHVDITRA